MNSQGTSPSFASSSQGWREISLYIFMCMLSMWIRLRFYIFRICVYVYKFFLNSRSLAGPLLNFFVNTGFWGWTQVNFLTRRYLSARIFSADIPWCLVLPTFGGSGLLWSFLAIPAGSDCFVLGGLLCFLFCIPVSPDATSFSTNATVDNVMYTP